MKNENVREYYDFFRSRYRDDQNAQGGFACPCIERELLWLDVDPNHRNNLGLCWNDVRRHVIRPEA